MKNDRNYYRMLSDTDLIEKAKGVGTISAALDNPAELALVLAERLEREKNKNYLNREDD